MSLVLFEVVAGECSLSALCASPAPFHSILHTSPSRLNRVADRSHDNPFPCVGFSFLFPPTGVRVVYTCFLPPSLPSRPVPSLFQRSPKHRSNPNDANPPAMHPASPKTKSRTVSFRYSWGEMGVVRKYKDPIVGWKGRDGATSTLLEYMNSCLFSLLQASCNVVQIVMLCRCMMKHRACALVACSLSLGSSLSV